MAETSMHRKARTSMFRMIDAAANRVSEGLRVVEEVARMHLDDRGLTSQLKQLRHDFQSTIETACLSRQIVVRDSSLDVGRTIQTAQEYTRQLPDITAGSATDDDQRAAADGWLSLVRANFKRAQQSLRTIEELAKLPDWTAPDLDAGGLAREFEQLRFRSYDLERAMAITLGNQPDFPEPCLYVLTDGLDWYTVCKNDQDQLDQLDWRGSRFARYIGALIQVGVDLIQLRDKQLSDRQQIAAGKAIGQLIRESSTGRPRWIMNDRVDLAWAADADGVHVGQEELKARDVRQLVGAEMLVGVSTHSLEQARQAVDEGADYIGVGPVFASNTKSFSTHAGVELVRQVINQISLPAFAIGGIDLNNADQVAAAGCHRVAVQGVFQRLADEPAALFDHTAQQLRHQLSPKTKSVADCPPDSE